MCGSFECGKFSALSVFFFKIVHMALTDDQRARDRPMPSIQSWSKLYIYCRANLRRDMHLDRLQEWPLLPMQAPYPEWPLRQILKFCVVMTRISWCCLLDQHSYSRNWFRGKCTSEMPNMLGWKRCSLVVVSWKIYPSMGLISSFQCDQVLIK